MIAILATFMLAPVAFTILLALGLLAQAFDFGIAERVCFCGMAISLIIATGCFCILGIDLAFDLLGWSL